MRRRGGLVGCGGKRRTSIQDTFNRVGNAIVVGTETRDAKEFDGGRGLSKWAEPNLTGLANPREYLEDVLTRLPALKDSREATGLTPANWLADRTGKAARPAA